MRWFGLRVCAAALALHGAGLAAQELPPVVSGPLAPLPVATGEIGSVEQIEVLEAYAELHTGPHRYFPVFFTVKRGEWVTVIGSQGNFLRVRTPNGEVGWVLRSELESSLNAAGVGQNARDRLIERYFKGRLLIGSSIGRLTTETMYDAWARYRINDLLSVQGVIAYQMGDYDGSGFWHVDGIAEPWPTATFSPFVGLGLGQLRDFPQHRSSQLPTTTAFLANIRGGLIYRFGEQFGVRLEVAQYGTIQTDRPIRSLYSYSVGMAFAF